MSEEAGTASGADSSAQTPPIAEFEIWKARLQQVEAIAADFMKLLQLELSLALGSAKRIMILALAILPLLLLTWIAFSCLIAWLVYQYSHSQGWGIFAFLMVQLLALYLIRLAWKHYQKDLSLPLTRQHMQNFYRSIKE